MMCFLSARGDKISPVSQTPFSVSSRLSSAQRMNSAVSIPIGSKFSAPGERNRHLAALCNRSIDAGDGEKAAVCKVAEEKQLRKRLVVFYVAGEKLPAAVKVQQAARTGDRFAVANKDAEHGIRQNAKRFCGVMARAVFRRRNR